MLDTRPNFYTMPPNDARIFRPDIDERIETPLDQRGLVDLDGLIEVVKQTVDPSFNWRSPFNDVHHLQWYSALYHNHDDPRLAVTFRELVNRKAYVPRAFHNWVHNVTLPPPVPSEEVMRHSIDAQRVAISLARTAAQAVKLSRRKMIGAQAKHDRLEQAFEAYNVLLDNAREVPREFSLLQVDEIEARSVEEMLIINKALGKLALDRIPLRDKAVQSTAA